MSEPEPELGLGVVAEVDRFRVELVFPATGDRRLYASDSPVLKRARFREGEQIRLRDGQAMTIEGVTEEEGLLLYSGSGVEVREDEVSDLASFASPHERLMGGKVDAGEAFDLRLEALRYSGEIKRSELRGFLGGRVELIPHQFYILNEVASRQLPRVLLADEVGLGKTIEACLILQRLRSVGRANRVLILLPEALIHQWFVELLRRFNLWFSIYDEERCRAIESSNPEGNPFLDAQLVLCSTSYLSQNETRAEQAIAAKWDLVIVDEAHHLEWSPELPSPEYRLVERLAEDSPGLLLLTATPTQLGVEGHFARLRLLDPDRYSDLETYGNEMEDFGAVARAAGKIADGHSLDEEDKKELRRIFSKDLEGLEAKMAAYKANEEGARKTLLQALLDEHGTGRVVFRNSRANMKGFPKRQYCPAPLEGGSRGKTLLAKLGREFEAEAKDDEDSIRYSFKGDPRLEWLTAFLKARKDLKVLLICKSKRKAIALEAALRDEINANMALFHEDLPLVQRDRNAAWFAEDEGARILICSEIGSEGRNFQFAHHLVLFDLPLSPGLLEQRIGRLDRIGQTATIQIHVPYVVDGPQELLADWYHQGLDAFETCLSGGNEFQAHFRDRLLELALRKGLRKGVPREELESFLDETSRFAENLGKRLSQGRNRLLELNSLDERVANELIQKIVAAENLSRARSVYFDLLDNFGVRLDEHEQGDVFIDSSHAFVEGFPGIPAEGMLATFNRERAISREDLVFLTADHPAVLEALDYVANSEFGTASFGLIESDEQNILVEAVYILETVGLGHLHIDRFLPPLPIRVLVDVRGRDLTHERDVAWVRSRLSNGSINRFLDSGFSVETLRSLLAGAESLAADEAAKAIKEAKADAKSALGAEIMRLRDLSKINENVSSEEIELARRELSGVIAGLASARLRIDSLRLIAEGEMQKFAELG